MTGNAAEDVLRGWLEDTGRRLAGHRKLVERALAQVSDEDFFRPLDGDAGSNSIAILVKHLSGNMRSRFTGFLTSDGEKPDRDRDSEFVPGGKTRPDLMRAWDEEWEKVAATLAELHPGNLGTTVTIASEPHSAIGAVSRHLAHVAYHAGQIALLAKHWAGPRWETLSVPRGGSAEYYEKIRRRTEGRR